MRAWILEWMGTATAQERETVLRTWYGIWAARNNARESSRMEEPEAIKDRITRLDEEWKSIKEASRLAGCRSRGT